jgi:hypothetical protein
MYEYCTVYNYERLHLGDIHGNGDEGEEDGSNVHNVPAVSEVVPAEKMSICNIYHGKVIIKKF